MIGELLSDVAVGCRPDKSSYWTRTLLCKLSNRISFVYLLRLSSLHFGVIRIIVWTWGAWRARIALFANLANLFRRPSVPTLKQWPEYLIWIFTVNSSVCCSHALLSFRKNYRNHLYSVEGVFKGKEGEGLPATAEANSNNSGTE